MRNVELRRCRVYVLHILSMPQGTLAAVDFPRVYIVINVYIVYSVSAQSLPIERELSQPPKA